ncbi:hypothetical protein [Lewinella sp. W8]|uniref:hypothetical protein n=1 Tax=Lewinella sp. W8 TaxID=2528208 RepID=UPI001067C60E|nr:hypothetical protein [Lewinella sp. W8]MTB52926.1 hypothetical protein [Lewinella sp. W8]
MIAKFNLDMVKLKMPLLLLFALGLFGLSAQSDNSQKIYQPIAGNEFQVKYMLVPDNGGVATSLSRFNGEVDLSLYPNAEIHIRVDALELMPGHTIKICNSCYGSEPNVGPTRTVNLTLRREGKHGSIIFGPLNNVSGQITLKVDVQLYKGATKVGREIHSDYHFKIKETGGGSTIKDIATGGTEVADPPVIDDSIGSTPDPMDDLEKKKKEANDYWKEYYLEGEVVFNRESNQKDIDGLRRHRKRYKSYLKNFKGINPERDAQAEKTLQKTIERLTVLLGENDEHQKLADNIRRNFRLLPTKILQQGERYEVGYKGNAGKEVSAVSRNNRACQVAKQNIGAVEVKINDRNIPCRIILTVVEYDVEDEVEIDAKALPPVVEFRHSNDSMRIVHKSGGEGPFNLVFSDKEIPEIATITVPFSELKPNKNGEVVLSTLPEKYTAGLVPGKEYIVDFVDNNNFSESSENSQVYYRHTGRSSIWVFLLIGLITLLIAGLTYYFYLQTRTGNQLTPEEQAALEERGVRIDVPEESGAASTNPKRPQIIIGGKKSAALAKPALAVAATTGANAFAAVGTSEVVDKLLISSRSDYKLVDLKNFWGKDKTIVDEIYLRNLFVRSVHEFVFDHREILQGRGDQVPEIGGFILGRHQQKTENGHYRLTFERFVPVEKDVNNSTTQLVFDSKAWDALETAKDYYGHQQLEMVGWFHTHPGWGVFLSGEDINTHETIFVKKSFYVAMELESLKSPYDVGFFTRYQKGNEFKLNTRSDNYHSWKKLAAWIGKRLE